MNKRNKCLSKQHHILKERVTLSYFPIVYPPLLSTVITFPPPLIFAPLPMRFLLPLLYFTTCAAHKIVILSPDLANSDVRQAFFCVVMFQILLAKKIAETLYKNGHTVTIVLYQSFEGRDNSDVKILDRINGMFWNWNGLKASSGHRQCIGGYSSSRLGQ